MLTHNPPERSLISKPSLSAVFDCKHSEWYKTCMGELFKCGDVTSGGKKVDTRNAIPNPMKNLEALACNVCPSLTSQTQHFHETGECSGELCTQTLSYWNAIR